MKWSDLRRVALPCLLSLGASLPFVETIGYQAAIHSRPIGRLQLFGVALVAWILMFGAFIANRPALEQIEATIGKWRKETRDRLPFLTFFVAIVGVLAVGLDASYVPIANLFRGKLAEVFVLIGIWGLMAAIGWFISKLVAGLGQSEGDLEDVMREWSLSIRFSILYYVFIAGAGWFLVRPDLMNDDVRPFFYVGFLKDVFLMAIIAQLLFGGLFKLAHHERLLDVFQNRSGFLNFVVLCGVIAIFAIWADTNYVDSERRKLFYPEVWQRNLVEYHIYGRDVGLLLGSIALLLLWTLDRVAHEKKKQVDLKQTQPSKRAGKQRNKAKKSKTGTDEGVAQPTILKPEEPEDQ